VENEYGSYSACDLVYTSTLKEIFQSYVGNAAVLFTTDGNSGSYLKCGKINGVYATVDFGACKLLFIHFYFY
jgi:beta-galactosidase